jgi:hypothetical protein
MDHSQSIAGHFEPEMQHTFLPGCRNCGGSHPLARKPVPIKTDVCPDCDSPVGAPGPTQIEKAAMGGTPSMILGRSMMFIGRKLSNLAKRI